MVIKEAVNNSALTRYRLGIVFIWLGVLTWMPFIILRIAGEKPALLLFLLLHLSGVIGGLRMRSLVRKELGLNAPSRVGGVLQAMP